MVRNQHGGSIGSAGEGEGNHRARHQVSVSGVVHCIRFGLERWIDLFFLAASGLPAGVFRFRRERGGYSGLRRASRRKKRRGASSTGAETDIEAPVPGKLPPMFSHE